MVGMRHRMKLKKKDNRIAALEEVIAVYRQTVKDTHGFMATMFGR